jgi:hypothetical protein
LMMELMEHEVTNDLQTNPVPLGRHTASSLLARSLPPLKHCTAFTVRD